MKRKLGIARPVAPAAAGDSEATDGHCGLLLAERPSLHRNHLLQHRESLKQGLGLSQSDRTHGDLTRGSTVWGGSRAGQVGAWPFELSPAGDG